MKFSVVLKHDEWKSFERILLDGISCIKKGAKDVSVISQAGGQVKPYLSDDKGILLYPVDIGDYINIKEDIDGSLLVCTYRVEKITDTAVIGGPC